MPALLFFFAVYLTYSAIEGWPPFGRPRLRLRQLSEATLLYYMNWRVLDSPLKAGDLTAFWSLSIEEQFYWVWPLALVGLAVVRGTAAATRSLWLIGAAAVARHALAGRRVPPLGLGGGLPPHRRAARRPPVGRAGRRPVPRAAACPGSSLGGRRSPSARSGSVLLSSGAGRRSLRVLRRHHALGAVAPAC